ncbi:MAG: hypothetical protein J6B85_13035 [Lachnospiraceae bacterium]|nr:hypothetical protein [Lachnospiraceae bacterium]
MRRILVAVCALLIGMIVAGNPVSAEQTEISLICEETEEGMNRYENAQGVGFETNISDGDTDAYMVIFSFDEGVIWKLVKDGEVIPYENEEFLMDAGSYSLMVTFSNITDVYATFNFRITEETDSEFGIFQFGEVIEDPDMSVSFDESRQMFHYRLPNGSGFYASVPQGGIAAMKATFEFSQEYSLTVKKDGASVQYDMSKGFTEAGVYTIRIVRTSGYDSSESDNNTYIVNFTFRVITGNVSSLNVVNAPEGFLLREIWLDGELQERKSDTWHWLAADGIYECIFTGKNDSSLFYSITFKKDTVAPFLKFSEGAFEKNAERIQYYPCEEGCTIVVTRDGEYYTPAANTLAAGGKYRISVSDSAGNVRIYSVQIQQSIQLFDYRMVILFACVVLVFGGYLVYIRTHMRIL